jgi:DNA topoisomerase-1
VRDASVDDDHVLLRFPAKSGQLWESELVDPRLARVLSERAGNAPDARLLGFVHDARDDGEGPDVWLPLDPAAINADVRDRTGGEFSSKDFRTLHGTVTAAVSLAARGPERTVSARKRAVAGAMREAAAVLGNTPAIARASYVDPRVVDLYDAGTTIDPERTASAEGELRRLLG